MLAACFEHPSDAIYSIGLDERDPSVMDGWMRTLVLMTFSTTGVW